MKTPICQYINFNQRSSQNKTKNFNNRWSTLSLRKLRVSSYLAWKNK